MTAVTLITAIVSASARLIGNRPSRTGANALAIVVPPNAADQRHPDLHRRQEPVGIPRQLGNQSAPLATAGQLLNLAVAERHQRHLRGREHPADQDKQENHDDVEHGLAHVGPPPPALCRRIPPLVPHWLLFSGMSQGRTSSSMPRRGRQRPARQRSGPTGADADQVRPTGRRQLPEGPAAPPRGDPYNCAITDSARFGADFDRLSMIITNDALEVWRWR